MECIISKPDKAKAKPARYEVPPRYHNVEYDVAGLLSTNFNNCCPQCNFKWSNKNDKLPLTAAGCFMRTCFLQVL